MPIGILMLLFFIVFYRKTTSALSACKHLPVDVSISLESLFDNWIIDYWLASAQRKRDNMRKLTRALVYHLAFELADLFERICNLCADEPQTPPATCSTCQRNVYF